MQPETAGMNEMPSTEIVARLIRGSTYEMLDAAEALGREGAAAVAFVSPLLHAEDPVVRWRGAIAMERIGAPALDALMAAAAVDDSAICAPAIWALEHIGDVRALGTLVSILNNGAEYCRWMAAAALWRIGGDGERALVEAAFADDPAGRAVVDELLLGC